MPDLTERMAGAIWGQFVGDAAGLGTHWIYNLDEMARQYPGGIHGFESPRPGHYHEKKHPGDQTHYGDAGLLLLESLADEGGFDEREFGLRLVRFFTDPACVSYQDHATRETLANLARKPGDFQNGSDDDETATVTRLAPLVALYAGRSDEEFFFAVEGCTLVTQKNATASGFAAAHALLLRELVLGKSLPEAFETTRKAAAVPCDVSDHLEAAASLQALEVTPATMKFGQSCHLTSSFPSALHAALRHPTDFKAAVLATLRAGGDNAARAAMVGSWLGASLGVDAIPQDWRQRLTLHDRIAQGIDKLMSKR